MALTDYKITSTDEAGKKHVDMPDVLSEVFSTSAEVKAFMDAYGQMVKAKHNGLIDAVNQEMEQKADKDLLQLKSPNFKLPTDAPSTYPDGLSLFYGLAANWGGDNATGVAYGCIVETVKYSTGYIRQTISASKDTSPLKFRVANSTDTWGAWQEITTVTQVQAMIDASLA